MADWVDELAAKNDAKAATAERRRIRKAIRPALRELRGLSRIVSEGPNDFDLAIKDIDAATRVQHAKGGKR